MNILKGLFHSRDKPKNRTAGSAYTFYTGRRAMLRSRLTVLPPVLHL